MILWRLIKEVLKFLLGAIVAIIVGSIGMLFFDGWLWYVFTIGTVLLLGLLFLDAKRIIQEGKSCES